MGRALFKTVMAFVEGLTVARPGSHHQAMIPHELHDRLGLAVAGDHQQSPHKSQCVVVARLLDKGLGDPGSNGFKVAAA